VAIGATQRDVQRRVLRQTAGLGIAGAAMDLGLVGALGPLVRNMLQDVWIDAAVGAVPVALLIGVVLTAAWMPAPRAARNESTLALKAQ
jgi:hypothetical protein